MHEAGKKIPTEMQTLIRLPDALYRVILSFVQLADGLEFARVTKAIASQLMKSVRRIHLRKKSSQEQFFQLDSYRSKILELLNDPWSQLKLSIDFHTVSLHWRIPPLKYNFLTTSVSYLQKSLQVEAFQVRTLYLKGSEWGSTDFEPFVAEGWLERLGLRELQFHKIDFTDLPTLDRLESFSLSSNKLITLKEFNIARYSSLTKLYLRNCPNVVDVSCLDHIYDLQLDSCDGITDISCLNNNYKIGIESCRNITDYSRSFRHSKKIRLLSYPPGQVNNHYHLEAAESVYELELWGFTVNVRDGFLVLPPSPYLRVLTVTNSLASFKLPENQLREAVISNCSGLHSCFNMGNIYKVTLKLLQLKSLDGLGPGNRVVELRLCSEITDFSPLRDCSKVSIFECHHFDPVQLSGVKELHVSGMNNDVLYKENITHFELKNIYPSLSAALRGLIGLKVLTIHSTLANKKEIFPTAIERGHIEKFIFEFDIRRVLLESNNDLKQKVADNFIIEIPFSSQQTVFLRRKP